MTSDREAYPNGRFSKPNLETMWFFNSSKYLPESGLLDGMTDYHCHLLPGVDDGVEHLPETLRILQQYEAWGIREVWLTPHIMEEFPNTTEELNIRFQALVEAYQQTQPIHPITLHLGSENMLDALFAQRLANNDLLPILDGKHLLVETSYFNPPMDLEELLEQIKEKGYIPVLAHPERYQYMEASDYRKLKALGVKFQLNIMSVFGHYGDRAQKKALELLKKGGYDWIGTDLHSEKALTLWKQQKVKGSLIQALKHII